MHIVFSGLDGAGKSTQIDLLIEHLKSQGHQPVYLWTRGGYTPLMNSLKDGLRRVSGNKAIPSSGPSEQRDKTLARPSIRKVWLHLAILDLIWIYAVKVRMWQSQGKVVVCDRYLDDTLLDFRQNFPQEDVERWLAWRLLRFLSAKADAIFLLLIPVDVSLKRSQQKDEPFPDSPEVLAWRLAEYQKLAQQRHWQILDGCQPLESVAIQIQSTVQSVNERGIVEPADAY